MAVAAPPEREQPVELDANAAPVDEAREHAIASLKRKRKFAQDSVAYVAVNGLLWLIWLFTGGSTGGFFLALDGWRAYGRWPASLNTPITEAEIDREVERTGGR